MSLAALWFATASRVMAQGDAPPQFKGTDIPAPPQQGQPWTPPKTDIPAPTLDAFTKLFQQGFPDPRGCDYREVKVVGSALFAGNSEVKMHAWVYAGKGDAKFAIGWDGLIYPVVSVLGPADLRADVSAMIEADKAMWQSEKKQNDAQPHPNPWMPQRWDASEHAFLDSQWKDELPHLHANEVAQLLKLGENDLAAKAWAQWSFAPAEAKRQSPYGGYAIGWIMRQESQMSDAYFRQDDRLALALARRFAPIRKAFDAEMTAHPAADGRRVPADAGEFSRQFLAELERRVAEPSFTPLLDSDSSHVSGPERIKLLIHDLEEVNAGGFLDGEASIDPDNPVITALVKEGDAAVGPLLECYEKDTRKTRAISDNQGGIEGVEIPERTFIGVDDAAYYVLTKVLKQDFYDPYKERDLSEAEIAGRIHAYLKKYTGVSQPEIWYRILTDDKTAPDRWLDAMEKVTFPADLADDYQPGMAGGGVSKPRLPGENPALMGEPLRNKTSPSVTDLLVGKMHALEKELDGSLSADRWHETLGSYDRVTRSLAAWDGRNHLDELRKASEIARQNSMSIDFRMWLYGKRDELGDTRALEEYAAWLGDIGISEYEADFEKVFQVAWEHPGSPAVQKTIAAMFADNGAWAHLWKPDRDYFHSLINSPLVGIAGFRQELQRGLADKTPAGDATVKDDKVTIGSIGWSEYDVDKTDPLLPAGGAQVEYRVCDLYAFYLRDLPAAPDCELYWPEARRDEAVAAAAQYLRDYGDLLQYVPGQGIADPDVDPDAKRVEIHFPKLDGPATEDDVKQHRAIFSLGDGSRPWTLPQTPAKVFWMAKKDAAHPAGLYGLAWQAEEKQVDGKWERWFGYVGQHGFERIPGAQIEFILPSTIQEMWGRQPGGIDTLLRDPGGAWPAYVPFGGEKTVALSASKPVRVEFSIRNRTGADMTFPPGFFQPQDRGKQLPPGVKISLACCEITPDSPAPGKTNNLEKLPWKEVPLRDGIPADTEKSPAPVTLGAAEKKTVFNIDLRDFFDLSKRGYYRLKVGCETPTPGISTANEAIFIIGDP
ncbi:MAG TPA: hypothetical protein VG733_10520 [Chthoniobacteraceae bacterium]|nr:hypothetical protein [Chthoniobacteraceae bacterium]